MENTNKSAKSLKYMGSMMQQTISEIIAVAYADIPAKTIRKYQNIRVNLEDKELKSKLGDYRHSADGSGTIRLFALRSEGNAELLITALHGASHHIDTISRGHSLHDADFYLIHKRLLFAAMDMGLLEKDDIVHSSSRARNRDKLAKLVSEYVRRPINNIGNNSEKASILVYNAYSQRDILKSKGYHWNPIELCWTKDCNPENVPSENEFLQTTGITDIEIIQTGKPMVSHRKTANVYGVPYDERDQLKAIGFMWNNSEKCWTKKIRGSFLPKEEASVLRNISNIRVEIV